MTKLAKTLLIACKTMMIDVSFKRNLITYCIEQQRISLQNVQTVMRETELEVAAYGAPKDRYDGFRNQQARKRNLYTKQLQQAMNNIRLLESIDADKPCLQAEFGAMLVTQELVLFVASGMGLIQFREMDVAVISTQVPLYQALKGKKVNETFSFNGKKYSIVQIF
jgi:transcription elongation GreA/GreB family factor